MEEKRKALVVFYSRTGVTRQVAAAIAAELPADSEEILDAKPRSGLLGWFSGARDATLKNTAQIKPLRADPDNYALVVIGTPVWAWTMTPAVRAFIHQQTQLKEVAFFCTMGNSGDLGTFNAMTELIGKTPLANLAVNHKEYKNGDYRAKVAQFVAQLKERI